ncbi:COG2426 family protein [Breznakiella homolactica]|uniref:Small multi-drug export protein n=1 Tax=Breznakiella homolactica TaxID=2798577 RepID=A0A7T7XL54_9SPIR|nr:small multi-drug export protein [Breznakiella homolactica]QQO08273.1 small multi-drug export protein [Breznakiella homolactica]
MNTVTVFLWTALLSFLPISELRGGIPFAIANGIPWYWAYPFAAAVNALVAPACWIFLSTFHKLFLRMGWYQRFFDRFVERARNKLHKGVEKWGWFGVALFVAIPLPVTGAWTGTLGAWVLGLQKRKTLPAVIIGVIIAGAIVTAVVTLGVQAFNIFIKQV